METKQQQQHEVMQQPTREGTWVQCPEHEAGIGWIELGKPQLGSTVAGSWHHLL
jgi:hypothetical protein